MTLTTKLAIGGVLIGTATLYLAVTGASASWQYYLTADECVRQADSLDGCRLRVSGKVAQGSLVADETQNELRFALEAAGDRLQVIHAGRGPENLKEGIDVVVEGQLQEGRVLQADTILTRCASKYDSASASSTSSP